MPLTHRARIVLIPLLVLVSACGPAGPVGQSRATDPSAQGRASGPSRLTVAIMGDPYTLSAKLNTSGPGSNVPGTDALEDLVNAGLANVDNSSALHPVLAETVPSIENGQWSILSDGRMETTWRLRPGLTWHDGAPFTADDLLFTATVSSDKDVGWEYDAAFNAIESVQAPDPRTLVVRWRQPFIEADTLFSHAISGRTVPLPRHVLEKPYLEDKASFLEQPYWSEQFVGTGPFKLRSWERGSHLIVGANETYALGRPRVDEIEVKFIPDPRTLAANVLAGTIDVTMGRGISLEQATQIRDQWQGGHIDVRLGNWIVVYPQLMDPNPQIIGNVQLRKALAHALDRQQMADTFQAGLSPVGHSYVTPQDPAYRDVEPSIVRYDYDPRRAAQMIEDLGYRRGADGMFDDPRIPVEVRVGAGDDQTEKSTFSVVNDWQRIGVAAEAQVVAAQRIRDREYAATFPGFYLRQNPNDPARLGRFHSSRIPLPENRFTGENNPRYANGEFDALLERYSVTIQRQERAQVLARIVNHISDRVIMLGLFYTNEPTLIANRVRNVTARPPNSTQAWNAHEWSADESADG